MKGHRVTVVFDILELKTVIDALETDIAWIRARLPRAPQKLRLEMDYMIARHTALRDRLNARYAPAYARLFATAGVPR